MVRAISETAKAEKANIILAKAVELYLKESYDSVKMVDIAKACGFSKGIIFYYFNSKEKLFLEIFKREYEKRCNSIIEEIKQLGSLSFDSLILFLLKEMNQLLDENSLYVRLTALMNSTLEDNLDYETAFDIKQMFYSIGLKIGELITERVSDITIEDCMKMLMTQHAIIVGYKSLTKTPDNIKQAIRENHMNAFDINFKESALQAMKYYLEGLHKECLERSYRQYGE
ncbi:DNA-binding transcriptional repressor AcrR [Clostridium puniceum]|uniref:DNA-binding transcriptional repressor AcrR n=1 Tax=Clostridium puniceum TaxID=29367 RepID=A0A1S8TVN4_9CLOT|nr:TetR family transcriptional regulator [Clostridium puniceum]OOM81669.1 DNA-binding transcriptional repressor AcrR [Clostridium puniceum]